MQNPPQTERSPDPALDAAESGSLALRFGTCIGASVVAAGVAAVPPTTHVASAAAPAASLPISWLACAAVVFIPMFVAVLLLRRARVGLRVLAAPDASARTVAVALWLFLLFVFEAAFGTVLRATTHHHALAGATFAVVSLGVAVVLGVLCVRLSTVIANRGAGLRRFLLVTIGGLLVLGVVVAALRFAPAFGASVESGPRAAPGALLVDLLAFGIAALFASRPSLAQHRPLAVAGPPVAISMLAVGLWSLRASPALAAAIAAHAPALAPIAALVAGH